MGAMAAIEKPEVGQLLDGLTITSGSDHVKINIDVPQDVLEKLTAKEEEEIEEN